MKALFAIAFALPLSAATAAAQDLESMNLANQLGTVLASEEACGLSYDQDAIAAFIEENVAADDMGFASTLRGMTKWQRSGLKSMSASERTAHCTQIRRVAVSYGFIKD
ncbi:signal recognition particle [Dichotomicrobium thermohalophilum]|uniref:Uncharacterized protein n=1 Tax=Dichotomicrobium thermohalophilum TaxID=933063 RepID=A0A397PCT9_9HYPH|nr:signal recognition particle [Dichotomicrobium thermohalophilum]RIA47316.1 hypothetical protein BXY53_2390 [Dichotomicrobium thermohalophilum]